MKIYFFVNSRMPSENAEGVETSKLCEALARKSKVTLIYPARRRAIEENIYNYYSVERNFESKRMPVLDLFFFDFKIFFYIEIVSFAIISVLYSFFVIKKNDIIFTHDTYLAFFFSLFRHNVVFDMHDFPRNHLGLHKWFLKRLLGITTTNNWKRGQLINVFGVAPDKVISHPNGVDLEKFGINISKSRARTELNLPEDRVVVEYVGMLRTMGMKKGVDTLLGAIKRLPDNIIAVLVGGYDNDIDYYAAMARDMGIGERVIFVGRVKHSDIPKYLFAADVLVAPFPKNEHYDHFMCPMKVIEYMASNRPMVVSDLESIREIVNDDMAYFFTPDDTKGFVNSILDILKHKDRSEGKAQAALKRSKMFTWDDRAKKIVDFLLMIR